MPMLATAGQVPKGPGWAFEFKWDGVRAVVAAAGDQVQLTSRLGNDVTAGYPELAGIGAVTGGRPVLLDGEIVVLDAAGRPDFGLLQDRMHVRHPSAELRARLPVSFYAFDVLYLDGESLLAASYDDRRARLATLAPPDRVLVPPSFTDIDGDQMLAVARQHGLEGVVAKRRAGRYEPGRRSPGWVKTALVRTQEVLVGGLTAGEGRRTATFGSLLLGAYDAAGALRYLGHVGTGFSDAVLVGLMTRLRPLARPTSPFDEVVPREHARKARWVEPVLVGEVEYRLVTRDGRLRHAAWRGLRPDRAPDSVMMPACADVQPRVPLRARVHTRAPVHIGAGGARSATAVHVRRQARWQDWRAASVIEEAAPRARAVEAAGARGGGSWAPRCSVGGRARPALVRAALIRRGRAGGGRRPGRAGRAAARVPSLDDPAADPLRRPRLAAAGGARGARGARQARGTGPAPARDGRRRARAGPWPGAGAHPALPPLGPAHEPGALPDRRGGRRGGHRPNARRGRHRPQRSRRLRRRRPHRSRAVAGLARLSSSISPTARPCARPSSWSHRTCSSGS